MKTTTQSLREEILIVCLLLHTSAQYNTLELLDVYDSYKRYKYYVML